MQSTILQENTTTTLNHTQIFYFAFEPICILYLGRSTDQRHRRAQSTGMHSSWSHLDKVQWSRLCTNYPKIYCCLLCSKQYFFPLTLTTELKDPRYVHWIGIHKTLWTDGTLCSALPSLGTDTWPTWNSHWETSRTCYDIWGTYWPCQAIFALALLLCRYHLCNHSWMNQSWMWNLKFFKSQDTAVGSGLWSSPIIWQSDRLILVRSPLAQLWQFCHQKEKLIFQTWCKIEYGSKNTQF